MAQSLRSLDYQGSFLYQNGGRLDTLRIFHSAIGVDSERERLVSLSGPRSEAVRRGELIFSSKQHEGVASYRGGAGARLLPLIPTDVGKLTRGGYQLRAAGSDRVAGYDSDVVDIVPADNYRYGYRLWLERVSHFPLRAALLADDQRTLEQFMFVTLSLGTAPAEADLALSGDTRSSLPAPSKAVLTNLTRWRVSDLPNGYELIARHAMANGDSNSEQLIFSDGLASVSAYIEPTSGSIDDDVALNRGAMNVYIRRDGEWRYTVLGNVPAATVSRIALSIRSVADATAPN